MPRKYAPTTDRYPRLPVLGPDEEQEIARLKCAGDMDSRERLILHNIGLAVRLVTRFRGGAFVRHFDDLLSIAVHALVFAADRYQPGVVSRGRVARFATFASTIIIQRLNLAMSDELALIRVPSVSAGTVGRDGEVRVPSGRTMENSIKIERMARVALGCQTCGMASRGGDDLDDRLNSLEARPIEPFEGEPAPPNPALSRAMRRLRKEYPKIHQVIAMKYPGGKVKGRELIEIGRELGCSREWARRLHDKGIEKLRAYLESEGVTRMEAAA